MGNCVRMTCGTNPIRVTVVHHAKHSLHLNDGAPVSRHASQSPDTLRQSDAAATNVRELTEGMSSATYDYNDDDDGSVSDILLQNPELFSIELTRSSAAHYARGHLSVDKMPVHNDAETAYYCSVRLRKVLNLVKSEQIQAADIIANLSYATKVLEDAHKRETNGSYDSDEDVIQKIENASVPDDLKSWITSTFSRSQVSLRHDKQKAKFRSIAQVVRVGLLVERRVSVAANFVMPLSANEILQNNMEKWNFDIFTFQELTDNHAIKFMGYSLFQKYNLIHKFKINNITLDNFFLKLEEGYSLHHNPYHNIMHAADVAQTCHQVMFQSNMARWLSDLEIIAVLLSALIHDYEHTGHTNTFHINSQSDYALLYNDRSILENHHVSAVYRFMADDSLNILSNLSKEDYRDLRGFVVEMVLATDMSNHFSQIKMVKNMVQLPEEELLDVLEKTKVMSLMLHTADISHPAKAWVLHQKWSMLLVEEFFQQGDKEAEMGLSYSPLCDRQNTPIPQSQIGFIDYIVEPAFAVFGDLLEKLVRPLFQAMNEQEKGGQDASRGSSKYQLEKPWQENLKENKRQWKYLADIDNEAEKKVESSAAKPLPTITEED